MNENTRRLLDQIAGLRQELAVELHKPTEESPRPCPYPG